MNLTFNSKWLHTIFIAVALSSLFISEVLCTTTVPEGPANVKLDVSTSESLAVTWYPPNDDGGSVVNAYTIEWDIEPGTKEVQEIMIGSNTGPNEIQTITTSANHINEVQIIRSTASTSHPEVQLITTTANNGQVLGGQFQITFDLTSTGGTSQTSGLINYDAVAMGTQSGFDRTSMEEILESMKNIGDVEVTRSDVDTEGGYTWTVTFIDPPSQVPSLYLGSNSLTGVGADITFTTVSEGNEINGSFKLTYEGLTTIPLPYNADASDVEYALNVLSSIHSVLVTRSGPDHQRGYVWSITFLNEDLETNESLINIGDVGDIVPDYSQLTGVNAIVTTCTDGSTSGVCSGHSERGNQIGGSFDLSIDADTPITIPFDTNEDDMKSLIETLPSAGVVSVVRSGPDHQRGYTWTITFNEKSGDLSEFNVNDSNLTGVNSVIQVKESRKGTVQEIQMISIKSSDGTTPVSGDLYIEFDGITTTLAIEASPADCATGSLQVQSALENLSNIGVITVASCVGPDVNGGYDYEVLFSSNAGDLPLVTVDTSTSTTSASTTISTVQDGTSERISGLFYVEFNGDQTSYLSYDVTEIGLKNALESLGTIGTVSVTRSTVDENNGYTWTVTFESNIGNVSPLNVDANALSGTDITAITTETTAGEAPLFNSGTGGLAMGTLTVTDIEDLKLN